MATSEEEAVIDEDYLQKEVYTEEKPKRALKEVDMTL